mmetsp:Transcript_25249/g.44823  ORF Transcript_25249/g.44823 Transcript_25249/m.44823 type:complete len:325 (-) Transcript_25249:670-1644(-)
MRKRRKRSRNTVSVTLHCRTVQYCSMIPLLPTTFAAASAVIPVLALQRHVTMMIGVLLLHSGSISTTITKTYEFGNGSSVQIENPMKVPLQESTTFMVLNDPQFLGAGGGGAVFSYRQQQLLGEDIHNHFTGNDDEQEAMVVVKFSWLQSAESVRNECRVLRVMEKKHVTGVERCLAQLEYNDDPRRTVIVMQPVVEDAVSSIGELPPEISRVAISGLIKAFVGMLAARVVTTDVQPLISKTTGELILIDMTEATILSDKLSDIDKALFNAFCTEIFSLIPDSLLDQASQSFLNELHGLEETNDVRLDNDICDIVRSLPILSDA